MGTNYYVVQTGCENACKHCPEEKEILLGKASAGWEFSFKADPSWIPTRAFESWFTLAQSGEIRSESGTVYTLGELMQTILEHKKNGNRKDDHEHTYTDKGCTFTDVDFC